MKARPADGHGDYVLFRRGVRYNDPEILLPPALAAQLKTVRDSADAELLALELAEREEAQAQRKKDKAEAEAAKPEPALNLEFGDYQLLIHEHSAGRYQVLVSPDAMKRRLLMLKEGLQSDRDQAKREEAAISAALKTGPDRCIVRPQ